MHPAIQLLDKLHLAIGREYVPGSFGPAWADPDFRRRFTETERAIDVLHAGETEAAMIATMSRHLAVWRSIPRPTLGVPVAEMYGAEATTAACSIVGVTQHSAEGRWPDDHVVDGGHCPCQNAAQITTRGGEGMPCGGGKGGKGGKGGGKKK